MNLSITTSLITKFIFSVLMFVTVSALNAQVVTIPSNNQSDSTDRRPYGCYYGYERTEALYTSSEIGITGNITKVAFYLNSSVDAATSTPVVIKMKTTAATSLTTATYATETTGATTVWSGNITTGMLINGWVTVTLNTTLNLPSSTDLIVMVETNYGANGGEMAHAKDFRLNKTTNNQCQIWYQDITAPTDNGVLNKMRPNIQLTLDAASCSGTPNAGVTLSTANPVCKSVNFTLSMSNISVGAGLTYQWKSSTDGIVYTDVSGATNATYTTSITATKYFKCKVTCSNGGGNAESTPVTVTLQPYYKCYCASYASTSEDTKIDSVKFGSINTGTDPFLCESYTDYTALSTSVTPGQPYSIHIANGSCIGEEQGAYSAVYIDYDHDGTFSQTNELVTFYGPITDVHSIPDATFFVPGAALAGLTGMRVIIQQGPAVPTYCGDYTRGETEDYLINVTAVSPCSGAPVIGSTLSTQDSVCCNEPFVLSLSSYPSATGLTYQWQSSTDGTNFSTISGATLQTYTASQCSALYYRCKVTCSNGGAVTNSTTLKVEMNLFYNCYCDSHASSSTDTKIDTVIFSNLTSISNLSQCESYTDYTSLAEANIVLNGITSIHIANGSCDSGQFFPSKVAVFIDYNHNGLFTDAGETVYTYGPTTSLYSIPNGNILVPANALQGITGMRIVLEEGDTIPSSCGTYTWGETEDYLVNITAIAVCTDPPTAGVATASIDSICSTSTPVNISLTLSGYSSGINQTYQWQWSADGVSNWTDISGATSTTATDVGVTTSRYYRCNVHCGNSTVPSSSDFVKVKPAPLGNTYDNPIIVPSIPYYTTNNNKASNCWTSNYTGINPQTSPDSYYKITTDTICELHVSTCTTTDLNTYLHLLNDTLGHIQSNNNSGPDCSGNNDSIVYNVSTYPATFYVVVEGYISAEGTYDLEIHCIQYLNADLLPSEKNEVSLYPNPNNGTFTLSFDLQNNVNDEGTLTISNAIGQVIDAENISVVNGRVQKEISLKNKADDGLYIVNIELKNSSLNKRFIIQH
ncbi:MAG: T9SS type A sorting domain-containing protein [Chitinophagales bacterium]|nr:T9SS type A sorting domain-containing protein [Chitinophagales bacterium]